MGRIRQTFIKRVGKDLLEKYSDTFKDDFESNKKFIRGLIDTQDLNCPSKTVRNRLAGCTVRLKQLEGRDLTYRPAPVKEKRKFSRR